MSSGRAPIPGGVCFTCTYWRRRCTQSPDLAAEWLMAFARPTADGVARVLRGSPPCPGHSPYGPMSSARGGLTLPAWQIPRSEP